MSNLPQRPDHHQPFDPPLSPTTPQVPGFPYPQSHGAVKPPAGSHSGAHALSPAYPPPIWHGGLPRINRMAIASLVTSSVALVIEYTTNILAGAPIGVVGAILGHVAARQIRRTGGSGRIVALAGITLGWIPSVVLLLVFGLFVTVVHGNG
ncbi:DUF4190 domain-containing protein [Krasilnikovia sp. M28-CT-15]|uniref:DUF4190 domain-containing protein n=1 Tax=Krasilnikovia sp. M28-CT-15 TaxID=3373540 RepID=UPI0038775636